MKAKVARCQGEMARYRAASGTTILTENLKCANAYPTSLNFLTTIRAAYTEEGTPVRRCRAYLRNYIDREAYGRG